MAKAALAVCACSLLPPLPPPAYLMLPELLPSSSGLGTILPSFCDLVVGSPLRNGSAKGPARVGGVRGWDGGTGVHTAVHQLSQPAAVWFTSAKASERALPSGPCRLKLRHVKRSPGAGGGEHAYCCNRVQIRSLASEGLSQF